jgi:hypothetical protein
MDPLVDGQRPLEVGASTYKVALNAEYAAQFVEGSGHAGVVLGAMDLLVDGQRSLEADASAGQVALGSEHAG